MRKKSFEKIWIFTYSDVCFNKLNAFNHKEKTMFLCVYKK